MKIRLLALHALCIIISLIFLVPLWWVVVSSIRPLEDIFRFTAPFQLEALFPRTLTFEAYTTIFNKGFGRAIFNTMFVAFATILGGLVVSGLAGFAFAKFRFPGKQPLFLLTVLTFMVPFEAIAIPSYTLIQQLGWLDTYLALIVPGIANGISIFLFRQFFAEIPDNLIEAARLDGAGWLTIFVRIVLPLSIPVVVSASLLMFLFQWEAFLWPLITIRSERLKVVQVALSDFQLQYQTLWNELFAASVVASLVSIILIFSLQRYYVQGVVGSGVKG